MRNIFSTLYAATFGALLNAIATLIPSTVDRAIAGFAKSDALLAQAISASNRRVSSELSLQADLFDEVEASGARVQDALADARRAERIRARIAKLVD